MNFVQISTNKAFNGSLTKYKFTSAALGGSETRLNVFLPPVAQSAPVPVLYYLAGLTCNEDTAPWKSGFLRDAAAEGIALIFPDTSPRGAGVEGEDADWDFGTGAGFYLDASAAKFKTHYNMYDLIIRELPQVLEASDLPLDLNRSSIFGHSMGGHGALTIYLRRLNSTNAFRSASAFAPICNPTLAPWGIKAFGGYLEGGVEEGKEWDATELISKLDGKDLHILADVGTGDDFYTKGQLLPENFIAAAKKVGATDVKVNMREGYDHSYYFISTFAQDHIKFHAKHLKA